MLKFLESFLGYGINCLFLTIQNVFLEENTKSRGEVFGLSSNNEHITIGEAQLTNMLTSTVHTLEELADMADSPRAADTYRAFASAECLMMVVTSSKNVGEAAVCVPHSGQSESPSVTVVKHPRFTIPVSDLFQVISPEMASRRSRESLAMKSTPVNPKYSTNHQVLRLQQENVAKVARLMAVLTGKPIEVRFQEAGGRNFPYLDEVVHP